MNVYIKNNAPLVSVLMPVYNAEEYIIAAIESVLNQTYLNFELIIIDDCSFDRSKEKISLFDDDRIRFISNDVNLGLIRTLNKGLEFCNGRYIARMDSDDICEKSRLEKQVLFMENNDHIVACGSNIINFNERLKVKTVYPQKHSDIFLSLLFFERNICHPSVIFRNVGLKYNLKYKYAEDYMYWYELTKYGRLANINDYCLNYRRHSSQVSSANYNEQINNSKKVLFEIYKDLFGFSEHKSIILVKFLTGESAFDSNVAKLVREIKLSNDIEFDSDSFEYFFSVKIIKSYWSQKLYFNMIFKVVGFIFKYKLKSLSYIKNSICLMRLK